MRIFFFTTAALAALPLTAGAEPDPDDAPIEQIVVRGDFRETALDELPSSISVLRAEDIQARGAHHLDDVLALIPNVNISAGSSRSRFFQIRGIGEQGQFIEPLNPSVGVLIDGVDLSDSAMAATMFDVEQIEVFHGPQGTRYGANALAGLINVRTRRPSDEFQASTALQAGNYDSWTLNGAVSGPLGKGVSARLAAQQHRSDGFIHNNFLDRDTNRRQEQSFRGRLHWQSSPQLSLDAMLAYVDLDNGYDAFSLDNTRSTLADQPGRDAQQTLMGSLELTWSGAEVFTVQASAAVADSDSLYSYDEDWVYEGFHPFGYSSTDAYLRERENLSAEIKLLSNQPFRLFGAATDWTAGVYALDRQENLRREYTFLTAPFNSSFDVERLAVFAELQTALTESTMLTVGGRYEQHESAYQDSAGLGFLPADDLYGWRFSLARTVREALMAYASISRGYKAGGFNTDGTLDADLRRYEPETLLNFELGLKGSFLEERLTARLTAFHMRRQDVQIASSITRLRDDGSTEFIDFVGNAAKGANSGLEAELVLRPNAAWQLIGTLGVLHSEYQSFINAAGEDLDGREQAHAPGYQFALRARYSPAESWYAELGAEGRDAFFFSDSHHLRSRPYELLSAAIGWRRGGWEARIWGRNLTDQDYATRGYFFGNDPRLDYSERGYTQFGDPRQFGVSIMWTFQ